MKEKVKKFFLIAAVNLVLIFILAELSCYISVIYKDIPKYDSYVYDTFEKTYERAKELMRAPVGLEYKKKPVLILGCSFAWGFGVDENENFGSRLSKLTKRPVYNRSFEWLFGPQTMLYQARLKEFYEEVPEPEYAVYVFIGDHVNRSCSKYLTPRPYYPFLNYKMKNGRLERNPERWYDRLYLTRLIGISKMQKVSEKEKYSIAAEHFRETKQEFDKHWKNYKFIILVYNQRGEKNELYDIGNLKNEGFTIIKTYDLIGRYLDLPGDFTHDNMHPSSKAWEIVTPAFVKEMHKRGMEI